MSTVRKIKAKIARHLKTLSPTQYGAGKRRAKNYLKSSGIGSFERGSLKQFRKTGSHKLSDIKETFATRKKFAGLLKAEKARGKLK